MFKRVKYITLGILAALMVSGCSEHLDVYNPSSVTDEFYNTKEGQETLLVDIYSKYRDVFNTGELQYYGTDLYMAITESPNERMFNGYDASFNSTAGVVGPYWSNLYKIVQESNTLLSRCSLEVEGMSESDFNSLKAQGTFLRALAYYYLVETFGDVPLYASEQQEIIREVTRTSESEVYEFLITDLANVKDLLEWSSKEPGRVNKAAVLQLLGKMHLTRAYKSYAQATDFEVAATYFDQIVEGSEGVYGLLDNYADVYHEENQNNSEVIWAIQYGLDRNYVGSGNPQQSLFAFNIVALEPDLFDRVQQDYSAANRKYWVNPRVHQLYENPYLDARYDATFQREFYVNNSENEDFGKLGLYFPRWSDDSGNSNEALRFYPFINDGAFNWYPQSTALPVLENGSDRMPIIKKFKDTKMIWGGPGTREDVVFRLADVYLLSAEAHLGAGTNEEALSRINTIRRRAAVDDGSETLMEVNSIDLDFILDERARELLGEHDRWFDLKRTGKLIRRVKEFNIHAQKYNNINSNHLVRPIPQDEINKVKGLTQNSGY